MISLANCLTLPTYVLRCPSNHLYIRNLVELETKIDQSHNDSLWQLAFNTIRELETENGILAAGKEEIYGCIFGRDSLITCLKLIKIYNRTNDVYFLNLAKKILHNLVKLQGKEVNIESGEQPGKCIHEFRPDKHEHLTKNLSNPWYVYPDNIMRNYDTVDATALLLIALQRYYKASGDVDFIEQCMPNILSALNWIKEYGDSNGDGFIDYEFSSQRKFGGLKVQNWMDSVESTFHEDGESFEYPIAPVEVQGYVFMALKLWANFFNSRRDPRGNSLNQQAMDLKKIFNEKFVLKDERGIFLAAAIDGKGKAMAVARSSMGHCLWAALSEEIDGSVECIVEDKYIPLIVRRILQPDLFEPKAGIRTLSNASKMYSAHSYHNGSIWPHDTSMVSEGLENFGYIAEASMVRNALLSAISHFKTAIELFAYIEDYEDYQSPHGQPACRNQAWSAASILKEVTSISLDPDYIKI